MSIEPTKCQCDSPGYCKLLKRTNDPEKGRYMSVVRHDECQNKPHYFEMFLSESEKYKVTNYPPGKPISDWDEKPCAHLKEVIDTRECQLCGLKGVMYEVRSCTVHGECSERTRNNSLQSCLTCEDYQEKE